MSRRSNGPAPEPWVTRAFALAAIAGVFGLGHSMIVPVYTSVEARIAAGSPSPVATEPGGSADAPAATGSGVPEPVVTEGTPEIEVIESAPSIPISVPAVAARPAFEIDLAEALAKWDEGALFLDARREDEFEVSRIAGAYFMPSRLVYDSNELLSGFIGQPVVIYCVGGDCDASKNTMAKLIDIGFPVEDISIMTASFSDWAAAGHPVEGGTP